MEASSIPPSLWASINNWFTPTVLFIFLNLMIAAILFTSNFPNHHRNIKKKQPPPNQSKLPESRSILHPLKSVNLLQQHPLEQQPPPENASLDTIDLDPTRLDDALELPPPNIQTHFVLDKHTVEKVTTHYDFGSTRIENEYPYSTKSDPNPAPTMVKPPSKMKKSASLKSAFSHFEEDKIVEARRPATVREQRSVTEDDDDVEVDAKADDFINKFKQQLKLQRLDSIVRYKDMLNRRTRV